ncbi:four helix bundle protein [Candidatus Parcubacteria bacterium]|nr:four helix bundle protein [Candidatus Parcubacteria bacterium]
MGTTKIQSFTDLRAWQKGHRLVLDVYRITRAFPREEQFGLTSQLRRAAVSFTSNIAEGFSRVSRREKVQFYTVALGSLTEIQNQLLIARDIGYLSKDQFGSIASQTVEAHKITRGLVRSIRP